MPPNESNSKVYEAIESDSHDSYLRKTYLALSPYLSIKDIEIKDIKTQQYKDLEEQNEALKQQLEAQAVSMQREMDEQKEQYEKKIRHVESVNLALSSQVTDIQNQLDNLANANDLKRIQEYISGHELVEKYNLASTIVEYFKEDVKKENFTGVTDSYIDDLITMAFNTNSALLSIESREDEYYKSDDDWKLIYSEIGHYEHDYIEGNGYVLSKSQSKKLANELESYSIVLWENKEKVDSSKVKSIIDGIVLRH